MTRARDNADLGDSYGSLAVGVTGGSGLNAVSPANLASGVLPVGVTGGSGLTALGTVTAGTLSTSVVNNINSIFFSGQLSGSTTLTSSAIILCDTNVVSNGMTIMTGEDAGKIKVVTAGKYLIIGGAYTQHIANAVAYAGIEIRLGGSTIAQSGVVGLTADAGRLYVSAQIIRAFSVDDEIDLYALINGDSIYGGLGTGFSILYLGQ